MLRKQLIDRKLDSDHASSDTPNYSRVANYIRYKTCMKFVEAHTDREREYNIRTRSRTWI